MKKKEDVTEPLYDAGDVSMDEQTNSMQENRNYAGIGTLSHHGKEGLHQSVILNPWMPIAIVVLYAILGSIWIVLSDNLIFSIAPDKDVLNSLQTYKGWIFVGLTALLFYILLAGAAWHLRARQEQMRESLSRLDLALAASNGGIWDQDLVRHELFLSKRVKELLGMSEASLVSPESWLFIVHPEERHMVEEGMRCMCAHPEKAHRLSYRILHTDGSYRWVHILGQCVVDGRGRPVRLVGVINDVTALKLAERRAEELAQYDALTGLVNRSVFQMYLSRAIADKKGGNAAFLVARLDLDAFMEVNSTHGNAAGDTVLIEMGRRLREASGNQGMVARLGGDEFAVLQWLEDPSSWNIMRAMRKLEDGIVRPFYVEDAQIDLTASIGASVYPTDADNAEQLMMNANITLAQARREGGKQARLYAQGMNEAFRARSALGKDLRQSVREGELGVYFQPIFRLSDQSLVGFEALARWQHPLQGAIAPDTFIDVAEDIGLISELGLFVMREACRQGARWHEMYGGHLYMAVNVSSIELATRSYDMSVAAILEETGLPHSCLELEVTETAVMGDIGRAAETLGRLRALGISIAIDDFGTGYSSLVALRRLPVSCLKIDRSFIDGLTSEAEDTAIVNSILDLAHSLELDVTAEGVETQEQLDYLIGRKCQRAQGFLLGRPMSSVVAERFLSGAVGRRGTQFANDEETSGGTVQQIKKVRPK